MKAKIVKSGKVVHLPTNEISLVLLESGLVEPVPEPPPKIGPPKTVWAVGEAIFTGEPMVAMRCETCLAADVVFNANETTRFWHCGTVDTVPPEILKRYRQARGG